MPVAFDFNNIKQRILNNLASKTEWSSFLDYGTASLLVDSIAQELAYEIQYKEYLTNENAWALARNKSSLLVEAPVHGYEVPRKVGSVGTLKIATSENFDIPPTNNVPLPKYFQFSNGDTFVVLDNNYVLTTGDNYIEVTAKQGKAKTLTFQALGNLFETKDIIDDSIENSLYDLYVNDVRWTKVSSLFEYSGTDLVYELKTDPTFNKVTLKFGNNVFGKKLNLGDVVLFQYVSTLGKNGNISSINNIEIVESQAYDNLGNPVDLYVTNTTAFAGGKDFPTLEEIRVLSPKIYQTGSRASTRDDYVTIMSQLDFISKVLVWGAYETNIDNNVDPWTFIPTEENVVHIAALNVLYDNLSFTEKNNIVNSIYTKSNPTDILKFETVEKVNIIFNVNAVVKNSSYILSQVKTNIEDTLINNYGIENINFGQNIYHSDLIRLLDEVEGVRNHNTAVQLQNNIIFDVPYIANLKLPIVPIKGVSLKFYIKEVSQPDSSYVLLSTSDANGTITSNGSLVYNTNGSSINLVTGLGTLIVNAGLSLPFTEYTIKSIYELNQNDLVLNKRNQIFQYSSSNITVTYPF